MGIVKNIVNEPKKNIIGHKLRILRTQKGISQTDLSRWLKDCGIPIENTALCKVESGKRGVSDYELFGIAQCLNIPVGSMFDDEYIGGQLI